MVCLSFDTTGKLATDLVKMETLDSGIGSRSPTPDSNHISHTNSSKATKVATHSNHINNNSHSSSTSSEGTHTNKTKSSDKGDLTTTVTAPSTTTTAPVAAATTATASSNGAAGGGSSSSNSHSTGSNSHNSQGNSTSSTNSKTYRDYSNRHSSGHGQYKKYGNHQNHNHYGGYGSHNVHYHHRYNGNGNRHYSNKHYNNSSNYHHHNNNHYQGQSYQHHQYQNHHYNHHGHSHNNNNNSNNGNSSGNSNNNSSISHSNSHHHSNQMSHHSQYFNPHSGAPVPTHHHNHHRTSAPPQVFISTDPGPVDSLSWTRRGGESTSNANWSSPNLDASDSSTSATAPISLPVLNKGYYSPSPQNASPATSPSNTDSSDAYSLQEENGNTTITVTAPGVSPANLRQSNAAEELHFSSPNSGAMMDPALNASIGPGQNGTTAGFAYQPFPYHPSGIYAFPGAGNHLITGGGRAYNHHNHHQFFSQGLLMPADSSYSLGKADSSIGSGSSEKGLEWSEDGLLIPCMSGTLDREDFSSSSGASHSDRSSTPDFIYASPFVFTNSGHFPPANKKRFYNGTGSMSGKLSPVPQNHRYHYPRKIPFGFPREFYDDLDPEEYVRAFSRFGEVTERPTALAQSPQNDSLSEGIWLKFLANQQTTDTFRKKMELWRDVYRILRQLNYNSNFKHDPRNFPQFGLQVVGSTMSGFGSNTSDVDMCLLVRGSDVDQRYEAVDKLQVLYGALSGTQWLDNVELIYAKVPILKFRDPKRFLEVDLNCNNFVGIRNTHLLYCYSQADWRLKPLVLVVKLWAHHHGINDAKNMTISSYSLVLMVIHFLQCGLEEPVLPVLQQMYPDKFNNSTNILHVKINEVLPVWQSKNKENIGNLLIQFLEYYAHKFDYSEHAVSVRTGGTIPIKVAAAFKSVKNDPHQWKYLCIEEPFDRTNTARSVYDRDTFDKILGIFNLSYQRLLASRNLESIFTHISETDARTMSVLSR